MYVLYETLLVLTLFILSFYFSLPTFICQMFALSTVGFVRYYRHWAYFGIIEV